MSRGTILLIAFIGAGLLIVIAIVNQSYQRAQHTPKMFDNIGITIQKVAMFIFVLAIVIGSLGIVIGGVRFLSELDRNTSFWEGIICTAEDAIRLPYTYGSLYRGKVLFTSGVICLLSSFSMLPLYGFGKLLQDISIIRESIQDADKKKIQTIQNYLAQKNTDATRQN